MYKLEDLMLACLFVCLLMKIGFRKRVQEGIFIVPPQPRNEIKLPIIIFHQPYLQYLLEHVCRYQAV